MVEAPSPLQPPLPERLRLLGRRLPAPAFGGGPVDLLARAGEGLVGEFEVEELHLLDLVAQAGGFLELEVGGGVAHPAFQILKGGLEVGADEGLGLLGDAGAGQAVEVAGLIGAVEDLLDVALDRLGRDAVFEVVGLLLLAAAVGLGDGALHRAGHAVGVEDDAAVDVARRAADGLDQGGLGAQEALLVRVEDGDQAALGDVEAFAQQVDAD